MAAWFASLMVRQSRGQATQGTSYEENFLEVLLPVDL